MNEIFIIINALNERCEFVGDGKWRIFMLFDSVGNRKIYLFQSLRMESAIFRSGIENRKSESTIIFIDH